MPSYKNVTSSRQTLGGKVVEPGKVVCTTSYHNENDVKLLRVDDAPYFNPILFSEIITSKGAIEVPKKNNQGEYVTRYAIHFYLEKGEVEILYNSVKNKPALKLYSGCRWNLRCFERTIDQIIVESNQSFILWVIMEKI